VKILFLCSGNIHRSPLAEAMLRNAIVRDGRSDIEVVSAGTLGLLSMPAAEEATILAREAGIDLSEHRSRAATPAMIDGADLIVVMEESHREWVAALDVSAVDRCRLLSENAGPDSGIAPGDDVPDAMGDDLKSFRRSFRIIDDCVARLYRELPPPPEEVYTRSVEERFRLRRGSPLTLSPADYDLVDRWWRRGVPLWILLETIDLLVGRKEATGDAGRVRRLSYCEEEVERRFESFERGRVTRTGGAEPAGGEERVRLAARLVAQAADRVRGRGLADAAGIIEEAARDLAARAGAAGDPGAAKFFLHSFDETLLEALRGATPSDDLTAIREEAESSLARHRDRMTPSAFEATVARLVGRRLREFYDLPDLTAL
jgi:protein-tyrosine phosphatase